MRGRGGGGSGGGGGVGVVGGGGGERRWGGRRGDGGAGWGGELPSAPRPASLPSARAGAAAASLRRCVGARRRRHSRGPLCTYATSSPPAPPARQGGRGRAAPLTGRGRAGPGRAGEGRPAAYRTAPHGAEPGPGVERTDGLRAVGRAVLGRGGGRQRPPEERGLRHGPRGGGGDRALGGGGGGVTDVGCPGRPPPSPGGRWWVPLSLSPVASCPSGSGGGGGGGTEEQEGSRADMEAGRCGAMSDREGGGRTRPQRRARFCHSRKAPKYPRRIAGRGGRALAPS